MSVTSPFRRGSLVGLAEVLESAAQQFPDLGVQVMVDLVPTTRVDAVQAEKLSSALISLLLNVRRHAHATVTVMHADDRHGVWTVTVHDDGVGFEPARVELGVGLAHVVIGELEACGVGVDIDSAPQQGTTVTLSGRSPHPRRGGSVG